MTFSSCPLTLALSRKGREGTPCDASWRRYALPKRPPLLDGRGGVRVEVIL
jgi:hypothetical protein